MVDATVSQSTAGNDVEQSIPKRRRLAQDVAGRLEDALKEQPRDVVAWRQLIDEYKAKDKIDELTDVYERILRLYPNSGEIWTEYIELTLQQAEFSKAEQLFGRALNKTPHIPLWSAYIDYVRRVNPTDSASVDQTKSYVTVSQAYEFALGKIQHDSMSGILWRQYLEFIEGKPAATTWDQQHKMDEIRKIYRRAVSLPLSNIETLWKAYNAFENDISRTTARKFIEERSSAYMTARSCMQKLNTLTLGLDKTTFPLARTYSTSEREQLRRWRQLIEWEKSDPLGANDPDTVKERVIFTLRQASVTLCLFPEIWYDISGYLLSVGMTREAIEFLQEGLEINPSSFLLTVRLGTILEQEERNDELTQTYRSLISHLQDIRKEDEPGNDITLAYVEFMRSTKRKLGLKDARKISSECRKLPYCTYEIYTASAAMELQNKDAVVAGKIYEIAYKKFREDPKFLSSYLKFLFQSGDETNARVVFEKAVTDLEPHSTRGLFDQFLEFEASFGDLPALVKLETRYLEIFPDADQVELFSRRYREFGSDPIGKELHVSSTSASTETEVPPAVMALLEKLPPDAYYDGPIINLEKLADLVIEFV